MKTAKIPYQIATVLMILLNTTAAQAQLTTGGEVAGGYLWIKPHHLDDHLKHLEGKGNLWLGPSTSRHAMISTGAGRTRVLTRCGHSMIMNIRIMIMYLGLSVCLLTQIS
jgi:hypothetical protein